MVKFSSVAQSDVELGDSDEAPVEQRFDNFQNNIF